MDEKLQAEIDNRVRELVSAEAGAYRDHLEKVFAHFKWAIVGLTATAVAVFFFMTGKTLGDIEQHAQRQIDDYIIENVVSDSIGKKLEGQIGLQVKSAGTRKLIADNVSDAVSGFVSNATSEIIEKQSNSLREFEANFNRALQDLQQAGDSTAGEILGKIAFPSGAVVAFATADCPEGWTVYEEGSGRFILGAATASSGSNQDGDLVLSQVGGTGGTAIHILTVDELPPHTHAFEGTAVSRGGWGTSERLERTLAIGDYGNFGSYAPTGNIQPTGGGKGHTNMPPFIALRFCRKS